MDIFVYRSSRHPDVFAFSTHEKATALPSSLAPWISEGNNQLLSADEFENVEIGEFVEEIKEVGYVVMFCTHNLVG